MCVHHEVIKCQLLSVLLPCDYFAKFDDTAVSQDSASHMISDGVPRSEIFSGMTRDCALYRRRISEHVCSAFCKAVPSCILIVLVLIRS